MFKSIKGQAAAGVAILAVVAVALGFGFAQDQDARPSDETTSARTEKIKVGTYEHQRVIQSFHKSIEFMAYYQELEGRYRAAEAAGDMQAMTEVQIEAQNLPMKEQEVIQSFNLAIDRVMPELARQHNLRAVALEIIYSGDAVEPEDITDAVIAAINEGVEMPEPLPGTDEPLPDDDDDDDDDDDEGDDDGDE